MFFVEATDKRGVVSMYNIEQCRKICVERDGNKGFKIKFYGKAGTDSFEVFYENESQANHDFAAFQKSLSQHHLFWKCSGVTPN